MTRPPTISLVICTLNRPAIVTQAIEDIWQLPTQPDELIIVDQTKELPAETERFYAEHAGRLTLIRMEPKGLGQARNRAIAAATGSVILFIDDDVRITEDIVRYHREHFADPTVGAVVGRIDDAHGDLPSGGGRVNWFGRVRVNRDVAAPHEVESLSGGNMSLRAAAVRAAGGFWELAGNSVQLREETDVSLRLRRAGYRILFDPKAVLLHLAVRGGSGTWTQTNRIKWYEDYFYAEFSYFFRNVARWKLPFYILSLARPIAACAVYYGRFQRRAIMAPWRALRRAWQ